MGKLVFGAGNWPSWLQWTSSPAVGTLVRVYSLHCWNPETGTVSLLVCKADPNPGWLYSTSLTVIGALKGRACSLFSQLRDLTVGNVCMPAYWVIFQLPEQESFWRGTSTSWGCSWCGEAGTTLKGDLPRQAGWVGQSWRINQCKLKMLELTPTSIQLSRLGEHRKIVYQLFFPPRVMCRSLPLWHCPKISQ